MKALTTNCGRYGHREFVIDYNETFVPASDVTWLLGFLEETVASGTKYEPYQTLQVGWTETLIGEAEYNRLQLLEPDWSGVLPFRYVSSVTKTLLHLRLQKDVADSLGILDRLSFPTLSQSAITCNQLGLLDCGVMDRVKSEGHDSGWFFGCNSTDHDHNESRNLKRMSLYEVACLLPVTAQFYALPPGINLQFGGDVSLLAFFNGKKLSIKEKSYLHKLYKRVSI